MFVRFGKGIFHQQGTVGPKFVDPVFRKKLSFCLKMNRKEENDFNTFKLKQFRNARFPLPPPFFPLLPSPSLSCFAFLSQEQLICSWSVIHHLHTHTRADNSVRLQIGMTR